LPAKQTVQILNLGFSYVEVLTALNNNYIVLIQLDTLII